MNTGRGQDDRNQSQEDKPASTGQIRQVPLSNDQLDSRDLFIGTRDITIVHGSEAYHLRLTAQNKLILTK